MRRFQHFGVILGITLVAVSGASAQWSNSTTTPLIIGDGGGANENSITIPAGDGGVFTIWNSTTPGGGGKYEVRVQRLSPAGVEMWGHNGIVVGSTESSSTVVGGADIALASDGGVFVTYCGYTTAFPSARNAFIQKFSPTGTKLWGTGGAALPILQSSFGGNPAHVCAMPDGGCVVGVTLALTPSTVYFMRLNSSGGAASGWNMANPPKIPASTLGAYLTQLQPGGADGSFIASWTLSATQSQFLTQKYTGLGAPFPGWSTPVVLDNHGLTSHDFPGFISDGAGGGIYAWHSYGATIMFGQTSDALLQHIHSDGTLQFPAGGLFTVGTPYTDPVGPGDPSLGRFSADVAYDAASQTYYVASQQGPRSNGVSNSVIVQKINAAGSRLWTDSGFFVTNQSGAGDVRCTATSDGCIVVGTITRSTQVNRALWAAKVVDDGFGGGMNAWGSTLRFINSDASTNKGRLSIVRQTGTDDAIMTYGIGSGGGSTMAAAKITAATGFPSIAPVAAEIVSSPPATVAACEGDVVTLSVVTSGDPTIAYRWYRHYASPVSGNPDAAWALNDGDSSFGCIVPNDGTIYAGTYSSTLTIKGVHRMPAQIGTCANPTDETLNSYRCAVFNVANDGPVFSGWSQLIISGKCHADFSCDNAVTIDDIFIFLNAWFAQNPRTDYDYSGAITIDDIFIYLNSWFAGCP
jgi:hypothetical protein